MKFAAGPKKILGAFDRAAAAIGYLVQNLGFRLIRAVRHYQARHLESNRRSLARASQREARWENDHNRSSAAIAPVRTPQAERRHETEPVLRPTSPTSLESQGGHVWGDLHTTRAQAPQDFNPLRGGKRPGGIELQFNKAHSSGELGHQASPLVPASPPAAPDPAGHPRSLAWRDPSMVRAFHDRLINAQRLACLNRPSTAGAGQNAPARPPAPPRAIGLPGRSP